MTFFWRGHCTTMNYAIWSDAATKVFRSLTFLTLLSSVAAPVKGQEGHPGWWWDSKSSDLIVEGTIAYDAKKHYEINPVNLPGDARKYYWILGTLKIDKILFVNKDSRHIESYRLYMKEVDKQHRVLIPAFQTQMFSSHGPVSNSLLLRPIMGLDIPDGPTIFNLSQIFVFPVLALNLESVVPRENLSDSIQLIRKRTNNLLTTK